MPTIKTEGLHRSYGLSFQLIAKDTTGVRSIIEDGYMPMVNGWIK